jgi:hypothetical protein
MPLVGLALGAPVGHAVGGAADDVAIGVLLYTLLASEQEEETRLAEFAQMRGVGAIMLGVSISSTNSRSASPSVCCAFQRDWSLVLIAVQASSSGSSGYVWEPGSV